MRNLRLITLFAAASLLPVLSVGDGSPFVGRWDFNIRSGGNSGAAWLGVTEDNGQLTVWYQPTGGNVYQVKDFHAQGTHLSVVLRAASENQSAITWELDAAGGKLTGAQKNGDRSTPLTGVRSPELNRAEPEGMDRPESLFNGKDLSGWEPIGKVAANSHWMLRTACC